MSKKYKEPYNMLTVNSCRDDKKLEFSGEYKTLIGIKVIKKLGDNFLLCIYLSWTLCLLYWAFETNWYFFM